MDSTGSEPAPEVLTRLGYSLGTGSELVSLVSRVCLLFFALSISSPLRARESFASSPARPSSVRIATTIAICPGLFLTFSEAFLTLVFPNKTKLSFCLFWILIGRLRYSVFSSSATCSCFATHAHDFFSLFFYSFLFFSFLFFWLGAN